MWRNPYVSKEELEAYTQQIYPLFQRFTDVAPNLPPEALSGSFTVLAPLPLEATDFSDIEHKNSKAFKPAAKDTYYFHVINRNGVPVGSTRSKRKTEFPSQGKLEMREISPNSPANIVTALKMIETQSPDAAVKVLLVPAYSITALAWQDDKGRHITITDNHWKKGNLEEGKTYSPAEIAKALRNQQPIMGIIDDGTPDNDESIHQKRLDQKRSKNKGPNERTP